MRDSVLGFVQSEVPEIHTEPNFIKWGSDYFLPSPSLYILAAQPQTFSQSIQGRVVLQTDLICHSSQEVVQALGTPSATFSLGEGAAVP